MTWRKLALLAGRSAIVSLRSIHLAIVPKRWIGKRVRLSHLVVSRAESCCIMRSPRMSAVEIALRGSRSSRSKHFFVPRRSPSNLGLLWWHEVRRKRCTGSAISWSRMMKVAPFEIIGRRLEHWWSRCRHLRRILTRHFVNGPFRGWAWGHHSRVIHDITTRWAVISLVPLLFRTFSPMMLLSFFWIARLCRRRTLLVIAMVGMTCISWISGATRKVIPLVFEAVAVTVTARTVTK